MAAPKKGRKVKYQNQILTEIRVLNIKIDPMFLIRMMKKIKNIKKIAKLKQTLKKKENLKFKNLMDSTLKKIHRLYHKEKF